MQSICILAVVYSFTHVQSSFQDKKYRYLILESTQPVALSNMTEDDWWHSNFQKDGQFECFSMRVRFQKTLPVSWLSRSAGVLE